MNDNLYFIANRGCDATTYGLANVPDDEFPRFKQFIEDLNKNSYYGCMPTISVYKISIDHLREFDCNTDEIGWGDDCVYADDVFHIGDKTYTFAEKYFSYWNELECVI